MTLLVRSAERAEISQPAVAPERGVPSLVSRQVGIPGEPAPVIDTVRATVRAAERRQVGYFIAIELRLPLGKDERGTGNGDRRDNDEDYPRTVTVVSWVGRQMRSVSVD